MHVLFIPSWWATTENPTRGVAFRDQALAVCALGHRVGVLVPPARLRSRIGLGETRRGLLGREALPATDPQLPTVQIPWWGTATLARRRRRAVVARAFASYVDAHGRPDVIHAHSALYGGFAAVAIREQQRIPLVITEHFSGMLASFIEGLRGSSPLWPDQHALVRETFRAADHCLAVGEPLAAVLRELVPEQRFEVLANCIDVDFFSPAPVPGYVPFRFLLVGGLTRRKRVDLCLTAFEQAFGGDARFMLTIVGEGPQRRRLEGLARRMGIADRVQFLGGRSRAEVRDLVQGSHAVVSSSMRETFGVTLIEAMACGRPVIASRSGGPETFVETESGLLVEPGDAADMASAMQRIVRDYVRFDQVRIRQHCVTRFGQLAIGSRLVEVYERLVARR